MIREAYYSKRKGVSKNKKLDFCMVKRLFCNVYKQFRSKGYFQENFGDSCVDTGLIEGKLGGDIEAVIFLRLRKENIWPIIENFSSDIPFGPSEEDLFDAMEFLYDHISKPIEGFHHTFNNCGYHYSLFDKEAGQS